MPALTSLLNNAILKSHLDLEVSIFVFTRKPNSGKIGVLIVCEYQHLKSVNQRNKKNVDNLRKNLKRRENKPCKYLKEMFSSKKEYRNSLYV
jgi:hypothetical protein